MSINLQCFPFYCIAFIVNPMMRHGVQACSGITLRGDSRQQNLCQNENKYCSCCITLIRIDTILSKNVYNNFQNLLFRKLVAQSGNQTDIIWKFYVPADKLWSPKTVGRVLGYATAKPISDLINLFFTEQIML